MTVYRIGRVWDKHLQQTDTQTVWDNPGFRSLDNTIVKYTKTIQDECLDILKVSTPVNMREFDPQHASLMFDDGWKTVWLKYFGKILPRRYGVLEQILRHPLVYNASISILEPRSGIPSHVGQCKALVKYHIPIYIPDGDVYMLYNGKRYNWNNRMLFNDTLPHMVVNNTDERRIILLIDILRPMTPIWNVVNHRICSLAWLDPVVRRRYHKLVSMV